MSDEHRDELAEQRTEWAQERTLLAKQRTFSAWIRTGLASIAVGFAVGRLLGEVQPQWLVQVIGVVLILIGSTIHAIGFWSYRRTFQKLEQAGTRGIPMWLIGTITAVLLVAALGIGLIVIR
jgi:putative membrane protein